MQKNKQFPLLVTFLFVIFISPGCKKFLDYIDHHPSGDSNLPQIKSFAYGGVGEPMWFDTLHITYDQWNNPIMMACSQDDQELGTRTMFLYDSLHRLVKMYNYSPFDSTLPYMGQPAFIPAQYMTFYYNGNSDVILADSVYYGPIFVNGVMVLYHSTRWRDEYYYDSYGRILIDSMPSLGGGGVGRHFSYNADGNRDAGPDAVYDNKTNFLRTNKIWQFLARDYSINNHFPNSYATYNVWDLPLTSSGFTGTGPVGTSLASFNQRPWTNFAIEYTK